MTARELFDYLMECCDKGFGDAVVIVCNHRENPLTDGECVVSALRIAEKGGDNTVVIQIG